MKGATMLKRNIPVILAGLSIIAALVAVSAAPGPPRQAPPPCLTEDGGPIPCVWDGPSRGTPGNPGYRRGDRVTITQRP